MRPAAPFAGRSTKAAALVTLSPAAAEFLPEGDVQQWGWNVRASDLLQLPTPLRLMEPRELLDSDRRELDSQPKHGPKVEFLVSESEMSALTRPSRGDLRVELPRSRTTKVEDQADKELADDDEFDSFSEVRAGKLGLELLRKDDGTDDSLPRTPADVNSDMEAGCELAPDDGGAGNAGTFAWGAGESFVGAGNAGTFAWGAGESFVGRQIVELAAGADLGAAGRIVLTMGFIGIIGICSIKGGGVIKVTVVLGRTNSCDRPQLSKFSPRGLVMASGADSWAALAVQLVEYAGVHTSTILSSAPTVSSDAAATFGGGETVEIATSLARWPMEASRSGVDGVLAMTPGGQGVSFPPGSKGQVAPWAIDIKTLEFIGAGSKIGVQPLLRQHASSGASRARARAFDPLRTARFVDIFILAHASGHRDITMAAKVVALDLPLHNTQPRAGGRVLTRKSLFSRMWAQPKPGYRALAFGGWFSTVIRLALGVGHTAGFPPPLPPLLFAGRLTCGHYKPVQLTLRPHSDDELSLGLGVARAFFDAFSLDGGPLGEWLGLRALPRWPGLLRLRVIRAEHLAPFVPSLHPRDLSPHWVAFIDNIAGQFALMKDDGEAPSRILASFWGLLVAADKSRAPSEANVSDSMGDDSCARAEGWTRVRALVELEKHCAGVEVQASANDSFACKYDIGFMLAMRKDGEQHVPATWLVKGEG
ncbi:hypothetical protein AK812_SmicGene36332 [Symbiodinium microadriaticum]|uniref:Uncharacterized protein n=1 Tax=Symbiodinium microadriaticum TaxID=2951 RepID=A0A1Q9CJ68_SYMMI|nr:hypothetical protein AK812_SmicGene36332 [Symbiodinium microadriaticum]